MIYILTLIIHNDNILIHYIRSAYINNGKAGREGMAGNREYKSDVFSMLMQDKRRALELYNAINNTEYDNPDDVEMVTLDGGI